MRENRASAAGRRENAGAPIDGGVPADRARPRSAGHFIAVALLLALALALGCFGGLAESGAAPEATTTPPTAADLADGYFRAIASVEQGTAGASLKLAVAAAGAASFAADHGLWDPDNDALCAGLLEGWESLTAEEQAAFDGNFPVVAAQIDECLENWDSLRPIFEDAGAAEQMDRVVFDPLNRLAWQNLCELTLGLRNDGR